MDIKIKQFVYRVRNRIREQFVIDNLIKFAVGGMVMAVFISLIALLVPFYYAVIVAAGVLMTSFFAGIIWGVKQTPTPMQAALMADALGHKEKISTAFYLHGKEDVFSQMQKKDAMEVIDQFHIRKEFPIRMAWKWVGVLLILTVAFVVSSLVDTKAKQTAQLRHEVSKEAQEEIARLEKVEKELEKNSKLAADEVADVKEQLENAKKELEAAETYEDLQKAEERINKKMEMASQDVKDRTLGDILEQAVEEAKELEKEEETKLAQEAKEALDKAANGSEKDKQDAYEKMKKLAAATGDEQLAQAAEAYKNSEYSDGDYANATQSLNQTMQNMSKSDYAQNTNGSNNNNQNNSNQNGGQNTNNQNNGQGSNGQNNSQKNGDGTQKDNGQSGSGQSGTGQNGTGNQGGGWNYGGREGKEGARKTNEDITVPDGKVGDDDNLTGKANGNDSSTKQKSDQSRTWSGNKVSYDEVSGEYKDNAYKKVDGSNYPEKMRDRIRDYFDGLN